MNEIDTLLSLAEQYELLACSERLIGNYFNKTNGRQVAIIIDDYGKRRTMSYPKYLMMKHLGLKVEDVINNSDWTVDHKDRNKMNNDINNLQLLPRAEHSAADTRRVKLVKLKCKICGKKFERSPRLLRDQARKGSASGFCSKKCSGIYARKRQLKQIDKLPAQEYVESKYYRNIKADLFIEQMVKKYEFIC